jgi:hypothetical protein
MNGKSFKGMGGRIKKKGGKYQIKRNTVKDGGIGD